MQSFKYSFLDGHIIFDLRDKRVLLDTGAPISVGPGRSATFCGRTFTLKGDYMGVNVTSLSKLVGAEIDVLMGMDIIGHHDCLMDPDTLHLTFGNDLSDLQLQVPVSQFMGIPIVSCRIGGKNLRVFFDTGAKLSYFDEADRFQYLEEEQDFYPGIGEFTTKVYEVPIQIAGEPTSLKMGILPPLLQTTLMMAGVSGILGTGLLEWFKICLSIQRQRVTFARIKGTGRRGGM